MPTLPTWSTNDEINYLRNLFSRRGRPAIIEYEQTMGSRADWCDINPDAVRAEIAMLLSDTPTLEQRLMAKGVIN